jgi:hypothetical protein
MVSSFTLGKISDFEATNNLPRINADCTDQHKQKHVAAREVFEGEVFAFTIAFYSYPRFSAQIRGEFCD